jgi:hypothetical protein
MFNCRPQGKVHRKNKNISQVPCPWDLPHDILKGTKLIFPYGLPVNATGSFSRNYMHCTYKHLCCIYFWKALCYWICLSALLNSKQMLRSDHLLNKRWQQPIKGYSPLQTALWVRLSIKLVSEYFVFSARQGTWVPMGTVITLLSFTLQENMGIHPYLHMRRIT